MNKLKLLLLFMLLSPLLLVAEYPYTTNEYVNDFAKIIDTSIEEELHQKLYDVEYYSGVEITVITIDTYAQYETGANSWEDFATGLFNYLGVGNTEHNNGVMLLISKEDRKIRIELGAGYSSKQNEIMKSIIDYKITPLLKSERYSEGILVGTDAIIEATTVPVSFFEYYKWDIIIFVIVLALLCTIITKVREKSPGIICLLLASAGLLFISIFNMLFGGLNSDGYGGGDSDGGGASGDF